MKELSPTALAFVQAARTAEGVAGPSPAERARVRQLARQSWVAETTSNKGHRAEHAIQGPRTAIAIDGPNGIVGARTSKTTTRVRRSHGSLWARSIAAGLTLVAAKSCVPAWAAVGIWFAAGVTVGVGVVAVSRPTAHPTHRANHSSTPLPAPTAFTPAIAEPPSVHAPPIELGDRPVLDTPPVPPVPPASSSSLPPLPVPSSSLPPADTSNILNLVSPTARPVGSAAMLSEETSLIRAVQEAIVARRIPSALQILDSYERKFPQGLLTVEAQAARVLATCALDPTQAKTLIAAFSRRWPDSPLVVRIRGACDRLPNAGSADGSRSQ